MTARLQEPGIVSEAADFQMKQNQVDSVNDCPQKLAKRVLLNNRSLVNLAKMVRHQLALKALSPKGLLVAASLGPSRSQYQYQTFADLVRNLSWLQASHGGLHAFLHQISERPKGT